MIALEPCVSINVFFKHLPDGFYDTKGKPGRSGGFFCFFIKLTSFNTDLFGNKDLPTAVTAVSAAEQAAKTLRQVLIFSFTTHNTSFI